MSTEEKAKAYDGLIERLKDLKFAYGFSSLSDTIEDIFPELKESEDERIRKGIIKYLEQSQFGEEHYCIDDDIVRDYIAWLEKQGEQKPADKVEPKFKVKYAGSEYNVLEVKDIAGVTFYGIEDEPNHIDYVKAENCEKISGYAIKENGSPYPTKPAVFSEQASAWSEEDEEALLRLTSFIEDWDKLVKGNKSIQECTLWSSDEHLAERLLNFLNSIRSQTTWKPSDEQIDELGKYSDNGVLRNLYYSLKKLKGEEV